MFEYGEIIDNLYQVYEPIGSGGLGEVYRARHLRLEKDVVVKEMKGGVTNPAEARREVDTLKGLSHKNLPMVYDYIDRDGKIFSVIDYISGITLEDYVLQGNIPDTALLYEWLAQLCDALSYLHSQNPVIIHSDIKPANIMLRENGQLCLIDFNISFDMAGEHQISGMTQGYAAPELYEYIYNKLNNLPTKGIVVDTRSDIYSLGAVFYFLMTRVMPKLQSNTFMPVTAYELPYPDSFVDMIARMMEFDPKDRYQSVAAISKAMQKLPARDRKLRGLRIATWVWNILFLGLIIVGLNISFYGYMDVQSEEFADSYHSFMESYRKQSKSESELLETGKALADSFGGKLAYERKENDYSALYVAIAVMEEEVSGDADTEEHYLDMALEYGNLDAYEAYVLYELRREDTVKARKMLSIAVQSGLDSYRRYYLSGRIYEAENEGNKAWMEYKKALLLAPDDKKEELNERIAYLEEE